LTKLKISGKFILITKEEKKWLRRKRKRNRCLNIIS